MREAPTVRGDAAAGEGKKLAPPDWAAGELAVTDDDERDLSKALREEYLKIIRARRGLVEHELTRRRTMLALTVVLSLASVVLAAIGHPLVGGGAAGGAVLSGAATVPRNRAVRNAEGSAEV